MRRVLRNVSASPATISKHITWIQAVLKHADDDGSEEGHRPARTLRFHTKESKLAAKAENKNQRARDLRANWTPKEIARLLAAPIWYGCADLDSRFTSGSEISIPRLTVQTSRASPWLYNAGAAFRPWHMMEFYGSFSRGLEEAGVAPLTASNANQVLDPVIVTQMELGARFTPLAKLSMIAGWFDTKKPYPAIDTGSRQYRFVGQEEHKGVEISLAGRATPNLTLVIGRVWIDPTVRRHDLLTDDIRPVGVPRLRVSASAEAGLAGIPGLSIDGGLVASSERPAQSLPTIAGKRQLMVPAVTLINMGMRYATRLGGQDVVLRTQIQNLFNRFAWDVDPSETVAPVPPRQARIVLSALF